MRIAADVGDRACVLLSVTDVAEEVERLCAGRPDWPEDVVVRQLVDAASRATKNPTAYICGAVDRLLDPRLTLPLRDRVRVRYEHLEKLGAELEASEGDDALEAFDEQHGVLAIERSVMPETGRPPEEWVDHLSQDELKRCSTLIETAIELLEQRLHPIDLEEF